MFLRIQEKITFDPYHKIFLQKLLVQNIESNGAIKVLTLQVLHSRNHKSSGTVHYKQGTKVQCTLYINLYLVHS